MITTFVSSFIAGFICFLLGYRYGKKDYFCNAKSHPGKCKDQCDFCLGLELGTAIKKKRDMNNNFCDHELSDTGKFDDLYVYLKCSECR